MLSDVPGNWQQIIGTCLVSVQNLKWCFIVYRSLHIFMKLYETEIE